MNSLQKFYNDEVVQSLKKEFGYTNKLAVPAVKKIILNVGVGHAVKDKEVINVVKSTLTRISGQRPVETLAKQSISNFKIRKGMVVGLKVTLRGHRMWDFLEKLIKITFPRIKDFRGLAFKGFDKSGNYSIGLKEVTPFPEITPEDLERTHGLEICFATTAKSIKEGQALFRELGFPYIKEGNK